MPAVAYLQILLLCSIWCLAFSYPIFCIFRKLLCICLSVLALPFDDFLDELFLDGGSHADGSGGSYAEHLATQLTDEPQARLETWALVQDQEDEEHDDGAIIISV